MYNEDHFAPQCYIDDILITGTSEQEHHHNLEEMLKRLSEYEIQVKREKSTFFKDTVEYLGHQISAEGLHTTPKKVEVIQTAPPLKIYKDCDPSLDWYTTVGNLSRTYIH